jgi:hypothetical protein
VTVNPNQHERIRADLKAFADGELSPLARFFVARHLRACPSCREELIQMQTLSTELQESETEVAPLSSDLRAHILDNAPVTDTELSPDQEVDKRSRRIARKKMVLALGVTAILAALVLPSLNPIGRENARKSQADRPPVPMPHSEPSAGDAASSSSPPVVTFSSNAGNVQSSGQNSIDTNGMLSDGHLKDRRSEPETLRGATDRLSGLDQAQRNEVLSVNGAASLNAPTQSTTDFSVSLSAPTGAASSFSVVPATRAVHREGSLTVAVQNAESAGDDATTIVKNVGGFIANTSLETGAGQRRTAVLDCRIPVTQFETVVKKIGALGTVRAKSLSGQDITAQVARSGARRQTLSNELSIAQARLRQKENSRKPDASDLYQLRAEVRTLRMQASQARAALETLQKYGSLSSLYVSLQDGLPAATATPRVAGWFDSLSPSSQSAWNAFLSNARLPLQLLLWVLAYSPLWLPALIIYRKYGRKWLTE